MPTITDNLNLFKPDPGQSGVAAELNGNWDQLDFRFDEAGGHTHDGTPGQGPKVPVTSLATTGTPSATTYLRGDGLWTTGTGGGGGVTDHGALTGLTDDDHSQYFNQSRGDTRYTQRSNNLSDVANTTTARTNLGAAATTHAHAGADITSGTVATARLGSGTPSTTTFLRGDQTWAIPGAGGSVNLDDLADVLITAPADNQVLSYDAAGARWINEAAAGGGMTAEDVDDRVNTLIVAGTGITKTYDDVANTLTIAATGGGGTAVLGYLPYATPPNLPPNVTAAAGAAPLADNGGAALTPILVTAPLTVESLTIRNTDTSGTRSMEWRLYREPSGGGGTLEEVAGLNGTDSFTASAASNRTSAAVTPSTIGPGLYWLCIRNTTPAGNWNIAGFAPSTSQTGMALNQTQRRDAIPALTSTLDATNVAWVKSPNMFAVRLNGRVFGLGSAF